MASDFAAAHHLKTGTLITAETTAGATLRLDRARRLRRTQAQPAAGRHDHHHQPLRPQLHHPGRQAPSSSPPADTGPADRAAVQAALKPFPTAQVDTLDGFITAQQAPVATLLNVFYVLLALCVVISLLGIINTLALTVTERTREIGVLRALGMTRTQLRRMIRIESQITALIGAATGIAAGLLLAALTARTLSAWNIGFAIPWTTLAILLAGALVAGTLAGVGPRPPGRAHGSPRGTVLRVKKEEAMAHTGTRPADAAYPRPAIKASGFPAALSLMSGRSRAQARSRPPGTILVVLSAGPKTLAEIEDAFRAYGRRLPAIPDPALAAAVKAPGWGVAWLWRWPGLSRPGGRPQAGMGTDSH